MTDIAIRVRNVTKDFEIYERPIDLALEVLTRKKRHRTFRALDDVSFEVERGRVLGIIGANGAGKSTLLKIITGVLDATAGTVEVSGRVTAILELGLGFNPEHSGRDNIYLSGMLYGMGRAKSTASSKSIIDFSGLRAFIEQPVKTYSSGMHARLAFSIATAVEPEILIIDEALAAGDAMFVQKSMRRIRQLCAGGRTVLVVSHGTSILAQLCRNVLWMEEGRIKMSGPALQVVQAYDLEAHQGADSESWIETIDDAAFSSTARGIARGSSGGRAAGGRRHSRCASRGHRLCHASAGRACDRTGGRDRKVCLPPRTHLHRCRHDAGSYWAAVDPAHDSAPVLVADRLLLQGAVPEETLGVALAVNRLADLEPVFQWYSQFIRPDETPDLYGKAPFRVKPSRRGTIELAFGYAPFRQGNYILSIGLLPNAPGTWEFYEYRHFFYPFYVSDVSLGVGAPIFFEPTAIKFADAGMTAEGDEAADD